MAHTNRRPTYDHNGVDARGHRVPPPMNLDSEAIVLSAIIWRPERLDVIADTLDPDHFYSEANRAIFEAMRQLSRDGVSIDVSTVANWLRDRERLDAIGGPAYLATIANESPAVPEVMDHVAIVVECSLKRRAIELCQTTAAVGHGDTGPTYDWLSDFAAKAEEIAAPKTVTKAQPIAFAIRKAYESLAAIEERGDGLLGIPTGLKDLDRVLGGLAGGAVTVIGARPGNGKTSISLCIAEYAAEHGKYEDKRVAAFVASMEMKREELALRQTFSRARVDKNKLKQMGKLDADDWERIAFAANELSQLPIWIDDTSSMNPTILRSRAKRVRAEAAQHGYRLGLVIVDYIQLMSGREGLDRGASREQEIASISRKLKQMAQDLDVHVIALSQLNRQLESRTVKDKRPRMADLRESGSLEQDADNVILIYLDELYNESSEKKGIAELLIEKQRGGQMKTVVDVRFTAWCTRFDNLAHGYSDSHAA